MRCIRSDRTGRRKRSSMAGCRCARCCATGKLRQRWWPAISQVMSRAELDEVAAGYKTIAGFDLAQLNARLGLMHL